MNDEIDQGTYGLSEIHPTTQIHAPELPYRPTLPGAYRPRIGLIGCGGIAESHLNAYLALGLDVVALCDVVGHSAEDRRVRYYPDADVYTDFHELLARDDIDVIDAATNPEPRLAIMEAAIEAGKHILSQKPFVTNLDDGERLIKRAKERGVHLAVNQNGRWAPHFSYMRQAVAEGLIGTVGSVHFSLQWDHTWTGSTPFNSVYYLILYDFGIHWFDMANVFMEGRTAQSVSASVRPFPSQIIDPPALAHVSIDYEDAQVTMCFNGHVQWGQQDETTVCGTDGTLRSVGPSLTDQSVTLFTADGHAEPTLIGTWFEQGFQGTMAELLCAIEEDCPPVNSAENALGSLELCLAALASAHDNGKPKKPGESRTFLSH